MVQILLNVLRGQSPADEETPDLAERRLTMLFMTLFGNVSEGWSLTEADRRLRQNPAACSDLSAVLEYRLHATPMRLEPTEPDVSGPLAIHGTYTRDEILAGLGHWTMPRRPECREGVLHLPKAKIDAFFVTLNKTEEAYSPTTMYEDYAISDQLFHWQSQSTTSVESPTGQRYINHKQVGYTPLLFVRENKQLPGGLASPYRYLGPAEHVRHEADRPISIVWRLKHPIPARLQRTTNRQMPA